MLLRSGITTLVVGLGVRRYGAPMIAALRPVVAGVGAATLILVGCASAAAARTSTTTAGLKKATWGKNVTVSYSRTTIRLRSNGIPNHSRPAQYALPNAGVQVPSAATASAADDPTTAQSYDYKIR